MLEDDNNVISYQTNNIQTWSRKNQESLTESILKECRIDSACIELAVRYLKILNMNVGNYFAQDHRITKQNKTMSKYTHKFPLTLIRVLDLHSRTLRTQTLVLLDVDSNLQKIYSEKANPLFCFSF
jgi:hypothetical protein